MASMEYRRLGKSGLKVSRDLPGHDDVRRPHRRGEARRIVARRATRASTSSTPRTCTRRASPSRSSARRSRRTAIAGCSRPRSPTRWAAIPTRRPRPALDDACDRREPRRLNTDYVDIYYCIATTRHADGGDRRAMGDLIRAGKVRYFGCRNYRGWRIAEAVDDCDELGVPPPVVCQPYYNAMNRRPRSRSCPPARTTAWRRALQPLARGVLTGKYMPGAPPPEVARRAQGPPHHGDRVSRGVARRSRRELKAHAEKKGMTRAHFALNWVRQPDRDQCIAGPRRSSSGRTTLARSARS